jgi:predicted metal-binding membrane protein
MNRPAVSARLSGDVRVLRRDRMVALTSLLALAGLAWLYLWWDAARMSAMPAMSGMSGGSGMTGGGAMGATATSPIWELGALALTFVMWSIMMVGMMLPSAAPAILLYGTMVRKNRERGSALPAVWIFAAGYLAVWTGFSLAATLLQAALQAGGLVTPMMASASPWLSGGLLVAAGIYQWLPLKEACLEKCRAPLQFFLFRWRPGSAGAFAMGAEHGLFCVGCCWALMLLLFTAGVMNLLWVAALAGFVLVEKLLPAARLTGRLAGIALVAAGGALMLGLWPL